VLEAQPPTQPHSRIVVSCVRQVQQFDHGIGRSGW
jgi:hypothetical protein